MFIATVYSIFCNCTLFLSYYKIYPILCKKSSKNWEQADLQEINCNTTNGDKLKIRQVEINLIQSSTENESKQIKI